MRVLRKHETALHRPCYTQGYAALTVLQAHPQSQNQKSVLNQQFSCSEKCICEVDEIHAGTYKCFPFPLLSSVRKNLIHHCGLSVY